MTETQEDENVIDEYQLVNMIADGTTTQIWEVKDQGATTSFAMKRLLPESMKKPESVATMKLEAKVAASLDHPNLIFLHKYVKTKKNIYLIMDYFRAPNLRSQISSDRISVQARLRKLIESTALALGHMHEKGWVHKDIKPENILISKSSEVKVIDFGLAVPVAKGIGKLFGKPKTIQGTRSYIAPETIKKQPLGREADVYSLGITIFEILTGKTPFHGENPKEVLIKHISEKPLPPSSLNPNVTPEFDEFVLQMLAKKPEARFRSMDEVTSSLRNLKMFKTEIADVVAQGKAEAEKEEKESMQEKRLDSRADARLSQLVKDDPELAKELIANRNANKKSKPKPEPPPQKKPQQPPQQPQQPQPMPGGYQPQYQQPMYPPQPMLSAAISSTAHDVPTTVPGATHASRRQYHHRRDTLSSHIHHSSTRNNLPATTSTRRTQQHPVQQPPPQQQPAAQQPAAQPQTNQPQTNQPPPPVQQQPVQQQPAEPANPENEQKNKNDEELPFMDELPDVI